MARKSLRGKEVVVISSDDDDDDDDDDVDVDENIRKYIRPVSVYKDLETRSKNNPYFLRRCLSYIIKAKKKKKSNSGGTITFNYRDLRNKKILKAEIVEKFSCPFCSMLCGGHGGLRHHLESSHDAFKYEFYGPEKDHGPEVDVSLESDTLRFGVLKDDVGEPQLNPFDFCWKHRKHRSQRDDSNNVKRLNIRFLELELKELPRGTENESTQVNDENVSTQRKTRSSKKTSVTLTRTQPAIAESSEPAVPHVSRRKQLYAENESTHVKDENVSTQPKAPSSKKTSDMLTRTQPEIAESSKKTSDILTRTQPEIAESSEKTSDILTRTQPEIAESSEPAVPHVSRRKQLYAARLKAKRLERLKSRQFYHSQTMQPMTFEEVMSDADSENEADDHDTLDLNERLRLQQIVGASQEEKRYMYLWNIFVRKQRVIADGHMPWACEEFTKLYKEEMKSTSTFDWWWRLFRIKLWNHGLICANTINKCTTILRNSEEGPSTSQGASDANKQQPMEVDADSDRGEV